ncbi:complement factor B isoform X1 [Oncorhynchus kisutch]|uniref:complement factor B isoform X1 n=1 Tax=Oncorhynchus kisutch TaxID=8019 RepID=UPI0012DF4759|nr:complement factor B isoform X1 [Oncorhynchus kisutch]
MELSVLWGLSVALLICPLYMDPTGVGVLCEVTCNEERMGMEGGSYTLTKKLEYGSIMIYHCPEGYYPHPALTRSCLKSGTWKPPPKRRPPQQCKMIECPNPLVLESGSVLPVQSQYFVNNKTTYECYSGYSLRGSASRVCQVNGKWSGGTPICSRDSGSEDRCADPGIPAGARRSGSSFGIDDILSYRCDDSLHLLGSKTRVCQESGQWTGTEPQCYYKHTYDTALEVTEAFGSAIRESLQMAAPVDDTDQEGKKITIDKGGKLNMYIAMDISDSIAETDFNSSRNAVKKLITKVSSFSVSPNYEIIFFASDVLEVVNIIDFSGDKRKPLEKVLTDLDNFKYDARDNVGTNLNLAFKTILERMAIQKLRNKMLFMEIHHVLIFFTDGAYNMGGSPENTMDKIRDSVYMNNKTKREKYLDVYVFGVGSDIFDEDIMPLVTKRNGERHYFKLKNVIDLEKTFDDIIDESQVVGVCGLHKNYDDNTPSTIRQRYPWMARIDNMHEVGKASKCMGSLVTRRFILTAAHCFKFDDKADNIRIAMGENQVIKGASRIILHPDYNINGKKNDGINEFYDYDVALIQLKNDVDVSIHIRPICIPCTKETSGALRLVGEAITCKQQEQLLFTNPLEEVSFISYDKKEQMDQRSDAKLKLQDQLRDNCIEMAVNEVEGITPLNLKDIVTDNFLCTGGRQPTRDNVACKGDSGGAVFKDYDKHRTIQVGVISWGTKNLCPGGNSDIKQESSETSRDFHINLFKVVPFLKKYLGNDTEDYQPLEFLEN